MSFTEMLGFLRLSTVLLVFLPGSSFSASWGSWPRSRVFLLQMLLKQARLKTTEHSAQKAFKYFDIYPYVVQSQ